MSMWRCPHCGTPQAETSRCWVCHRSSTTCSTCRNFRVSVAAQVGYCGLDRRRLPLAGTELRGCWQAGAAGTFDSAAMSAPPRGRSAADHGREFVPVELQRDRAAGPTAMPMPSAAIPQAAIPSALLDTPADLASADRLTGRPTLFGELDR